MERERDDEPLAELMEAVAREVLGEPNHALSSKTELRFGKRGSVSVDLEKGVWMDHEAMQGGGVLDLLTSRLGLSGRDAFEWLEEKGIKRKSDGGGDRRDNVVKLGNIVETYDYTDEAGQFLCQVVRFEPKDFRQRHRNGAGDWVWNIRGIRRVPFKLPELTEALAEDRLVFIVEGEKDVLNLHKLGVPATCNLMGAGAWHEDLNSIFTNADVVVIADNDPQAKDKNGKLRFHKDGRPVLPGQDHANHVCSELQGVARRVRYLDLKAAWPGCPWKGDISDWIAAGGGAEQLFSIAEDLRDWSPADNTPTVPITFPFPINGEEIPRRQWLIPGFLLRRHVTVLVAPAGSGKSLLTLQMAMMGATAMHWGGWRPRQQLRSLVVNTEDDADEMRRRLFAAAELMQCDMRELRQQIAFADQPENIIIAKADNKTKTVVRTPMVESLVRTIIDNQFDVVTVDPFAETFEGDENSNSELKWAAVLWREIARRTNAAVLLVHHTRKFGAEAGDMTAARGGSALIGVARIVSTLFGMTEDEAKTFGIDPDDRGSYLRFDDAKANLTLVTFAARWFTKETVTLPNAGEHEAADDVGVLKPWKPPNPFDDIDTAIANKILDSIELGVFDDDGKATGDPYTMKKSGGGKRWAGKVVQHHTKCSDRDAQKVLQKWITNGVLEEVPVVTSTSKGKARLGLKVNATARPGQKLDEEML